MSHYTGSKLYFCVSVCNAGEQIRKRRCKAAFSYAPQHEDELELKVGDVIEVITEVRHVFQSVPAVSTPRRTSVSSSCVCLHKSFATVRAFFCLSACESIFVCKSVALHACVWSGRGGLVGGISEREGWDVSLQFYQRGPDGVGHAFFRRAHVTGGATQQPHE